MKNSLLVTLVLGMACLLVACGDDISVEQRSKFRFTYEQSGDTGAFNSTITYLTDRNTNLDFIYPDSAASVKPPRRITVDSTVTMYRLQTLDSVKAFFVGYNLSWKKDRNKKGWKGNTLTITLKVWEDDELIFEDEDLYLVTPPDTVRSNSWTKEVLLNARK